MIPILCIGLGFLLGGMPFSFWLGKLFLHTDIRRYGDGNPGAFNAWRAGNYKVGLPSLLLDYLKGAVPVGLANFILGVAGWWMVPIALSPVFGHAFSPFLRFRGGKAVAATFGIWSGLTLWVGPSILGLFLSLFNLLQKVDAWSVIFGVLGLLFYLLLSRASLPVLVIWMGNTLILAWKHRSELRQRIQFRPSILKR